jgi:hypothetical protein
VSRTPTVPNTVYERTREGLAGLLPGRAARSVLDKALAAERRTPDAISADEMASVLLGRVYRDLRGVVPSKGLRRQIKQLARTIRASERPRRPQTRGDAAAPYLIGTDDVTTPAPGATGATATHARVVRGTASFTRSLPDDADAVLVALAVLDGVHGAAEFDAAGRARSVRGELPDPDALGRVIAAGGELLGRHGTLRTVCVTTSTGVLVAVPVPPYWLAVTGEHDLNLGAVYAALAALEEER